MAEKIITCKEGKVAEKDGKDWVELVDQEDKTHRIFRSIQNNEGVWVHLDKEVDMLKGKIEDGSVNGLTLKLTKEKKGTFWNVIGVELVENVFVREAQKQVVDEQAIIKNRSVALSYAKDFAVSRNIPVYDTIECAEIFYRYMVGELTIKDGQVLDFLRRKGGKDEDKTQQTDKASLPVEQPETAEEVSTDEDRQVLPVEPITNAKELMAWALSHGKEFTPSWVRKEANITPNTIITDEIAVEAYKTIKASTGWNKK